jgi:anti-sigma B factor antagonist
MTFEAEVRGRTLLIQFHGDLTGDGLFDRLQSVIDKEIESGIQTCVADLADVRFMNSSGISVLLRILTRFRNKGGEMYLIRPSEHLSRLLVVSKLHSVFPIINSADEVPSPDGKS